MNNRKRTIVYISGKMTGLPDLGRANFNYAEQVLSSAGYVVLNPALLPEGMAYPQYMAIAVAMLQQADMICMLPGWETSRGASAEKAYAESVGMPVVSLMEFLNVANNLRNSYSEAI